MDVKYSDYISENITDFLAKYGRTEKKDGTTE